MPDDVDAAGPARSHAQSRRASTAERTSTHEVRLRRWAPVSAFPAPRCGQSGDGPEC
jgi:hypothetical protein